MTYGINITNELNETVVDFNKSLIIAESGMTTPAVDAGMAHKPGSFWEWRGPQTHELATYIGQEVARDAFPHVIGTTSRAIIAEGFSVNNRVPSPLSPVTTTFFYQVGTIGLLHHSEHVLDGEFSVSSSPNQGVFGICLPRNNTPISYIKVDAGTPDISGDSYGLQLRDAANQVVFDSRANVLSISEVLFIPKQAIAGMMDNGDVLNLTLRTPVPNCYIATTNHTSFKVLTGSNVRYRHIWIRQTSYTNVRLSSVLHGPSFSSNQGHGVDNDLVLIIARNPFG